MALKLSLACSASSQGATNTATLPLLQGEVAATGIEFATSVVEMPELVRRQFEFHEFDVSELSISSLIIALSKGDDSFIALPIFPTRKFHHTGILVRDDAGIDRPEDLVGKRVAVPEYQQASAVWIRGALQHEFGVAPSMMRWFMERLPERSHGGATGFVPPVDLDFQYIPAENNTGAMMLSGELDAALVYMPDANEIDRSSADLKSAAGIRRLFPDARAEEIRYYEKTGIYPTNHVVAIKREIAEQDPWIVHSIFDAFVQAKELSYARGDRPPSLGADRALDGGTTGIEESDPLPYGLARSRRSMEALTAYSFEQGLSVRRVGIEEIFHPATLGS